MTLSSHPAPLLTRLTRDAERDRAGGGRGMNSLGNDSALENFPHLIMYPVSGPFSKK